MAQTDYFLKVDGIDGESKDDKYKKFIEVHHFEWHEANKGTSAAGGGGGSGKVKMGDLVVLKQADVSSPKLMKACATGQHIPKVMLAVRKAGGSQQEYYKITLSDVVVSGHYTLGVGDPEFQYGFEYGITGNDGTNGSVNWEMLPADVTPVPMEQVTFNFSKIEYEYRVQDSKGNVGGPTKAGWDLKANKTV